MQEPVVAPPSCSALYGTPLLAPHPLPGSHCTRVSMYWDISQNIEELEPLIPGLVRAMDESRSPVVLITYSTSSHNWNLAFVSLAASQLTALEYLFIQNGVYGGEDWRSDGDAFIAPVHEKMMQNLPVFKALKVLRFESTDFNVRPRRTFDDDFATARQWATLCPTLVYCCLPLTHARWIRHDSFPFFVADIYIQKVHPKGYNSPLWDIRWYEEEDDFADAFVE